MPDSTRAWLGNDPLPNDLGWDLVNGQLRQVLSHQPPEPGVLPNILFHATACVDVREDVDAEGHNVFCGMQRVSWYEL